MTILVINAGSTSLKADVLHPATGVRTRQVRVERVGEPSAFIHVDDREPMEASVPDATAAVDLALRHLGDALSDVRAVGHRVVHGGETFTAPTLVDDTVLDGISALSPLAPLHQPGNLAGLRAARAALPDVPHVAVFDTAFHATLPARARHYALPADLAQRHGIRRYGFHGPSHQLTAERVAAHLGTDPRELRLITCHLGGGASLCAVEYGRSVDTTMGMTPLEGLVMGTRAGDIDAGVLLHLMRAEGLDADALDDLLNRRSGLAGLSGGRADLRDIEARAGEGDEAARLAIQVFAHRVRRYLGAFTVDMGGVDAIAFTAGIGEHSALMRHRILQRLDGLGARLDEDANRDAVVSSAAPVAAIHDPSSRVKLFVVHGDEALSIARQTWRIAEQLDTVSDARPIPIAVSARHVHLTQAAVEALFGPGHTLTPRNPLSQPGQFACEETVDVIGPKRTIEGVRVLGPTRPGCQVEVSRTDEFFLGVDAPVRLSGDLKGTPGITLRGPAGTLTLTSGLICALRHIHMTPDDARAYGVQDRDVVEVEVTGSGRSLVFGDVIVRVSPKFALEMHVDTDEANAAELPRQAEGRIYTETSGRALLRRRDTRYDPAG